MNCLRLTIAVVAATIVTLAVHVEADAKCDLCQAIAGKMKATLTEDVISSMAEKALEVCDQISSDDQKHQCQLKVQEFVQQAEYLLQHTPKELCQKLGVCSQDVAYLRQLMGDRKDLKEIERMRDSYLANYQKEIQSLLTTRTTSFVGCETCLMILKQIQQLVKMPQVMNAMDKAVEMTCEKIAGANVNECIEQSKGYAHEAIKFIEEQDPRVICSMIGECDSVKTKFFKRVTGSVICDECKRAVDRVKAKLQDKEVRNQIEALITRACNQLPDDSIRQQCYQYTSQIIDKAIEQLESSSFAKICQALHVC